VSEVPGTTRDAIEAAVALEGFPFRLVDTAGIRTSSDSVEQLGVEVAKDRLGKADLIVFCLEAGATESEEVREFLAKLKDVPLVLLRTKSDLQSSKKEALPGRTTLAPTMVLEVSSVDNTGIPELRRLLPRLVYSGLVKTGVSVPLLLQRRQIKAVGLARDHVKNFIREVRSGVPIELACVRLQSAEGCLEELTGTLCLEEVLDSLFASFCIGK
jgi:tRNA modification GTPase